MKNHWNKLLLAVAALLTSTVVQAQVPSCVNGSASDPDGDGWGWENNRSCLVATAPTFPNCASAASDPDGDGWGWENNRSCKVAASTSFPTCASASSDPDGDGWGWENNRSCKVAARTGSAPAQTFSVGTKVVDFYRGNRYLPTKIYYPATLRGRNTPIASGRFPLVLYSHGLGGTYDTYVNVIEPLTQAGFVVAAPNYPFTKAGTTTYFDDVFSGNQSLDASQVITYVLALGNTAGDLLYGHIDNTLGVGAAGHSLGGITTHGLLGLRRDNRVTAAVIFAGQSLGTPTGPAAKVLFEHGDLDPTVTYANGRAAYNAIPWTKAMLTHLGQAHDAYMWSNGSTHPQAQRTEVDWFRWGLYGDGTARDRLSSDANAGGRTSWEFRF